jgi:hypothetical protein
VAAIAASAPPSAAPAPVIAVTSAPATAPTSDPAGKAQAAAVAVRALLADAAQARSDVLGATGGLSSCTLDAGSADQALGQAIIERQQLMQRLSTTSFAGLPHGLGLRTLLHRAWSQSLQADEAFLQWTRDFESPARCGAKDPYFAKGTRLSLSASKSKASFAKAWNGYVAKALHVAPVTAQQL